MRRLRTVFFGTSEFAVPSLRAVLSDHDVLAVITQPDRPVGRKLGLTPTPIKRRALDLGLKVHAPERLDDVTIGSIAQLRPELLACASYGKILPPSLLAIDGMTALNVHPSLLPLYRGATPIQAALRDGVGRTGVSIIRMTSKMDAGPIAVAAQLGIEAADTYGTLHEKLAALGGRALAQAAALLAAGSLPQTDQDEAQATYTRPLSKADAQLCFDRPAAAVVNFIRSLSPQPCAWTVLRSRRLKVLAGRAEGGLPSAAAGSLIELGAEGPLLAAGTGAVRLLRVIPEARREMSGADFARMLRADGQTVRLA
ncbi:MAG: methionyl-tRNA formyltransferase [Candidatus Eremiobacteraeota bacterium]|nr:methionyl-tRNA formyltransferase [Candidatus Eremiobacteraeota bacterium]